MAVRFVLIIFMLFISATIYCQQLPVGLYHSETGYSLLSIENNKNLFALQGPKNHIFTYFKGTYLLMDDTLKIEFISTPDPGHHTIISVKPLDENYSVKYNSLLHLNTYIFPLNKNKPIVKDEFAQLYDSAEVLDQYIVHLYDTSDSIISSFKSFNSKSSIFLTNNIKKIAISSFHRDYDVIIPISECMGKEAEIKVFIYRKTYNFNKSNFAESYLIKEISNNSITLSDHQNNKIKYICIK